MACQTLSSGLTQSNRPTSALSQDSRPGTDGFCRSYNFAQGDDLVTFVLEQPMITFVTGNQIETFA